MKIIVAARMGMCFGVRDAIALAHEVANPHAVTIHGELVHNQQVLQELAERGFSIQRESQRSQLPGRPQVLITAHGISDRERQRLLDAGKELIDTTCPLVHRVHEAAQDLQHRGFFVVVIGKPRHVEVLGITGDLDRYAVVQSVDEVECYPADRIGVVCQTTTPPTQAAAIREAIEEKNAGRTIEFVDTICHPTRLRQEAARGLLDQVDVLLVVGGRNSHNTRQLGLLAEQHGVPWFHVETAADLRPEWFGPDDVVGLTAGTSTPADVIESVHRALVSWAATGADGVGPSAGEIPDAVPCPETQPGIA